MFKALFDRFKTEEGLVALKVIRTHGIINTVVISVEEDSLNDLLHTTLSKDDFIVEVFRSVRALNLAVRYVVIRLSPAKYGSHITVDLQKRELSDGTWWVLGPTLSTRLVEVLKNKKKFIYLKYPMRDSRATTLRDPETYVTYRDKTKVKENALALKPDGSMGVLENRSLLTLLSLANKNGPVTQGVYCLVNHLRCTKLHQKTARIKGGRLTVNLTKGSCSFSGGPLQPSVVEYVRGVSKNPYPK